MLNDMDFQVWRSELRKFLHQGNNSMLMSGGSGGVYGSISASIDKSDELLNSSIRTLEMQNAAMPSVEIKNVLIALGQIQEQHTLMRQNLARRPRSEMSRTSTPINRPLSRPGGSPNPRTLNTALLDATGKGSDAEADPAGGFLSVDGGHGRTSLSTAVSVDDGDFYDAADEVGDGVEYEMEPGDDEEYDDDIEQSGSRNVDVDDDDDNDNIVERNSVPVAAASATAKSDQPMQITYREKLPAPVTGEEVSLFSILKKNVGKDLSAISFPVTFNSPLSLLQAVAEEYEYAPDLLERAAKSNDSVERILLVGAFAISGYASTAVRTSRKPFNPLLGETFECVRTDRRLNFVSEKVVHRPPVAASYAYGDGWNVTASGTVKNKFWGKSLELISEGAETVELATGDKYSISKPSSFMRNLLAGTKYLEHVGEMNVTNLTTKETLVVQFKEGSMFGGVANRNHIEGTVYDANNSKVGSMKGRWDEGVSRVMPNGKPELLWQAAKLPPNAQDYYGFTYFAISLNEITDDIRNILPPTDSRLRPDQRALEEGDADSAEKKKHVLETSQRERRKVMEDNGTTHTPQWFHLAQDGTTWEYGGEGGREYFKMREEIARTNGKWDVPLSDMFQT